MSHPPDKVCASCGRRFSWRKKWERTWDEVRFCSQACRRRGVNALDRRLEAEILRLLERRGKDGSICPSEAARTVDPEAWRGLLEDTRRAARRLAHQGRLAITQRGWTVDPADFKGPVRLRLPDA